MAEGLLRHLYGNRFMVYSAGTAPGTVHPLALMAMRKRGIDITGHDSQHVEKYAGTPIDYVVTVCDSARKHCPYIPARRKNLHERFTDPSIAGGTQEERLQVFCEIREKIEQWIERFVTGIEQEV